MKQFNLEEALNGKPVKLCDGSKAIVLSRIPDNYKLENGLKVTFPLLGIILDTNGAVDDPYASWKDNGMFASCTSDYDIVGMWHDLSTQEEIFVKAYAKDLVLTGYDSLNNTTLEVKLIGKTKGKNKGYIAQEEGDYVYTQEQYVNDDPSVSCSYGLHIGNWAYVKDFSGYHVAQVVVKPEDVVSVPFDYNGGKLRSKGYSIVKILTGNPKLEDFPEVPVTFEATNNVYVGETR